MYFFNPLNLEMTAVTIITSGADMRGPLVTVYTLLVLRIDTIGCKILVHDMVYMVHIIKPGVSLGEGGITRIH